MSSDTNQPVVEETVEVTPESEATPVMEAPVVAEVPDIVYEYQPVDDLGRPLGSKQVFKGKTNDEILAKVAKAHQEAIKLNRELNKKNRLGNIEVDEIPQDAERIDESELSFEPKPLTNEERIQLSRDLLDPDKFDEASARLLEANLGARPDRIRQILTKTQDDISAMRAREAAKAFVQNTPGYYACKENFDTMTNWMLKNNLAPTKNNFSFAYNKLEEVGLLLKAPIVREEPVIQPPVVTETPVNSQPESEPASRITSVEPSQAKRTPKIASGLTKDNTSDVGPVVASKKLTVKEIEAMPSEVYKQKLKDPSFVKAVNEAYAPKR